MDPDALAALRRSYELAGLDEAEVSVDPFDQFSRWLADAVAAELLEPNAMVLATADAVGRPSTRTVLLKGLGQGGFDFYTNYGSRKAAELSANPNASVLFPWFDLERQVIAVGQVQRLPADESRTYFHARPLGHQLGSWASRQSEVVASRQVVERRYAELARRFGDDVPAPDFWGGYRLVPQAVEFWQGRSNRLHDRLRYRRIEPAGTWVVERLSP